MESDAVRVRVSASGEHTMGSLAGPRQCSPSLWGSDQPVRPALSNSPSRVRFERALAFGLTSAVLAACTPDAAAFGVGVAHRSPVLRETRTGVMQSLRAPALPKRQDPLRLRGSRQVTSGTLGVGMILDPSVAALPDVAVYLAVAGSLTGAAPLILVDKNTLNLAIGALSGMVASAVVFPIDTAKTRIQAAGDEDETLNTYQTIRQIIKDDGVGALYRGLLPVIVGAAPESAIQLTVFELVQRLLGGNTVPLSEPTVLVLMIAGVCAGTAQVIVTNPLEVLKISAQTNTGPPKSTPQLVKELGPSGLFKGWQATLSRDIPFAGIYFPCYIQAKNMFSSMLPNPLWAAMVSGLVAGMFAAGITTPADVIKTNIQTTRPPAPVAVNVADSHQEENSKDQHAREHEGGRKTEVTGQRVESIPGNTQETYNVLSMAQKIYAKKGWQGFFSGLDARISRQAPAMGVSLFVFESLKQTFRKKLLLGSIVEVAVSDDVTGIKYYASRYDPNPLGQNTGFATTAASTAMSALPDALPDAGFEVLGQNTGVATNTASTAFSALPDALPDAGFEAARITQIALPFSVSSALGGVEVGSTLQSLNADVATQNINMELSSQSAVTAAAALSQNVLQGVVVPVWECGGYYLGVDTLGSCVNQALEQF